jgi:hypothetical protein
MRCIEGAYDDERPAELPVPPKPPREVVLREEVVVVERLVLREVGAMLVRWGDDDVLVRDEPGQMLRDDRESPELYEGPQLPQRRERRHGSVCCGCAGVAPGAIETPPVGDGTGFAVPCACCGGTTQSRRGGVIA